MKTYLLWIATAITLASCGDQAEKGDFKITGHLNNAPLGQVALEELTLKEIKTVDTTTLKDASGKFAFKGMVPEQGLYRIRFGNGKYILLSLDAGDMKIDGDYDNLEKITIQGSESSVELQQLLNDINDKSKQMTEDMRNVDSLRNLNTPDSLLEPKIERIKGSQKAFQQHILDFTEKTNSPANAVFALSMLGSDPGILLENKKVLDGVKKRFPKNTFVKSLTDRLSEIETASKQAGSAAGGGGEEESMTAVKVGDVAPDFTLPDQTGKTVSLSSFRGKYLLVDFWASWCRPCRMENPNVVQAYQQFKDKNFAILGVSLDKQKDAWQKAIKDDGLIWSHVSDLKFWESAVVSLYGIQGIPTNFLLDPQGKIVATNLRGEGLTAKLKEVLK